MINKNTMNLTSQFFKKSSLSPLDLVKIGIIIFVSIHLLGSFVPFYNGADSLVYGISSIGLAEGSWGFTNELLLESGSWDFVPNQWVKTIYNTAIPIGGFGIYGLAAISYLVGGLYGLFYLVPIFTIILLIITERVATKLFGNFVGLFTLVLLSTDATVFNIGRSLLSNNIFAVFFILGVFFLIKFLQESKYRSILLSSAFFATCTLFRLTGLIFFPIEIFSVVGYLAIQKIRQNKRDQIDKNGTLVTNLVFSNLTSKNLIKISAFLLIPWIIFFSFYFIYNDYFFGDPFTSYVEVMPSPTISDYKKDSITSFLIVDSDRFEWIKYYSVALIPDTSKSYIGNNFSVDVNDPHANWLSIFSFIILASALSISLFNRNNRISVIVILLFVASLPLFFSSTYLHSASYQELLPSPGLADRYMIPILPLFFMISGFIAERIWKLNIDRTISNKSKRVFKILKIIFLIILIIFFVASFLNSPSAQKTISNNFIFQNPQDNYLRLSKYFLCLLF